MTPEQLQAKVDLGYGKAAGKIGLPHTIYRVAAPYLTPLDAPNEIGIIPVAAAADLRFHKLQKPENPYIYLIANHAALQVGDYLKGPIGTLWVMEKLPMVTVGAVRCNDYVNITRAAYGADTSGNLAETETVIATMLPVWSQIDKTDTPAAGGTREFASTARWMLSSLKLKLPIDCGAQAHDIVTIAGSGERLIIEAINANTFCLDAVARSAEL